MVAFHKAKDDNGFTIHIEGLRMIIESCHKNSWGKCDVNTIDE